MTQVVLSNNAVTTLASPLTSGATTLALSAGTGLLFPSPGAGQFFPLTLTPASTPNGPPREIVYCTSRSVDTLTIVRAQEGTSAASWSAGDNAQLLPTAGAMALYAQLDSPNLSGYVHVPLRSTGDISDAAASTAYVYNEASSLITAALVSALQSSAAGNGWFSLSTASMDILVQWGTNTIGAPTNVTFPRSFPHACFGVLVCEANAGGGSWAASAPSVHGASAYNTTGYQGWSETWDVSAHAWVAGSNAQFFIAVGW